MDSTLEYSYMNNYSTNDIKINSEEIVNNDSFLSSKIINNYTKGNLITNYNFDKIGSSNYSLEKVYGYENDTLLNENKTNSPKENLTAYDSTSRSDDLSLETLKKKSIMVQKINKIQLPEQKNNSSKREPLFSNLFNKINISDSNYLVCEDNTNDLSLNDSDIYLTSNEKISNYINDVVLSKGEPESMYKLKASYDIAIVELNKSSSGFKNSSFTDLTSDITQGNSKKDFKSYDFKLSSNKYDFNSGPSAFSNYTNDKEKIYNNSLEKIYGYENNSLIIDNKLNDSSSNNSAIDISVIKKVSPYVHDEVLAHEVLSKAGPESMYQRKEYSHDIGMAEVDTTIYHDYKKTDFNSEFNKISEEYSNLVNVIELNTETNITNSNDVINQDPDPIRITKPNGENLIYKQKVIKINENNCE